MRAPALQKGDTIAIAATARWVNPESLSKAGEFIKNNGFNAFIHPGNKLRYHEFAGTLEERAAALHDVFRDDSIKAVIIAAGGLRTLHLLDYIDFDVIRAHPKILVGYSDTTALLNALYVKCGLVTFHGPDAARLAKPDFAGDSDLLLRLLTTGGAEYDMKDARIFKPGKATGPLIGGNLCILNYLLGTEFAPSFEGAILFIEDEMEELRNIDRMLLQLRRLGRLERVAGLMVGGFTMTLNNGRVPFPWDVGELIAEYTQDLDIPVLLNAPFGHGDRLQTLPVGSPATLDLSGEQPHFELAEKPVQVLNG